MSEAAPARIGVDLGGTKIEAIVMQGDGTISHRQRCKTPSGDYFAIISAITESIATLSEQADLDSAVPIGIGTPGAISYKTGLMMNCNSTCLNHQPLSSDLKAATGRNIRIANDADCFALSEASDGAAQNSRFTFGVILGTGVGGGLVIDKRLDLGVNAIRGEWGHNTLPIKVLQHKLAAALINAPHRCFCGRQDCVETWVSGPAMQRHYELVTGHVAKAQTIIERMRAGDLVSRQLFEAQLHLLALALANLINILDPDSIVFGGGLSNIDELYSELPKILPRYVFSDVLNTELVKAKHGDSSGVRGAAWLWAQEEVQQILRKPE